jgi:adenylylsulfate kinase-like enzyme
VNARALIIAAPRSGSGKTTVTLALTAALRRRGVAVRCAKSGQRLRQCRQLGDAAQNAGGGACRGGA